MRLDAATDNLLQTRDLLIGHFEHQLLQLQDVRTALHETAREAVAIAKQVEQSKVAAMSKLPPAISPMQSMNLESLFAPLNAVQHLNPMAEVSGPAEVSEELPVQPMEILPAETLFEAEPLPSWETSMAETSSGVAVNAASPSCVQVKTSANHLVSPGDLDPELEKATLDELNEALTRAFAQIATRHAHS